MPFILTASIVVPHIHYATCLASHLLTWLVTKEEFKLEAEEVFADTSVQITVEGRPHLGAPLGCTAYVSQFVCQKVQQWSTELRALSEIASIQPHAAFAALTHGLSSKWSYVTRTTPSIGHLLQPLDAILRSTLIPNLTGRPPPNYIDLRLFALPFRLGGLGITPLQLMLIVILKHP